MLFKSKTNRSLIKTKEPSLTHLNNLNNFLQNQQNITQYITKEIKNQKQLSKKNEVIIDKSICKINEDGESLIRKYQQEKEKHEKIEFLVKHIEDQIYRAKLDKSMELKNKIETDKLEEYTTILKNKEKQLQKVCEKTNTSSYELSKKLDSIRALRSERTIVSALFDKIQRQLCNLEHCYNVLVIERNIEQHQYMQKVEEFNKYQNSGNKQLQKVLSKNNTQRDKDITEQRAPEQFKTNAKINTQACEPLARASFCFGQELNSNTKYSSSELGRGEKQKLKQKKFKLQQDMVKISRQKKVKIILNDLQINSVKELPADIGVLENDNQKLLHQATKIYQEILTLQESIIKLNKNKKSKPEPSVRKWELSFKKNMLDKAETQINQNKLELGQFQQVCKIVLQSIKESNNGEDGIIKDDFLNEQQEMVYYLAQIQQYFQRSYIDSINCLTKPKKQKVQSKRLTALLSTHHFQRNHMSIYEQKQLLDFAKKNLQKMQKSSIFKTEK